MQTTELWGTWPSSWLLKTHLSIPNTAFSNFLEDPEWTLPTSELIREISMDSLGIRGVVDGEGLEIRDIPRLVNFDYCMSTLDAVFQTAVKTDPDHDFAKN